MAKNRHTGKKHRLSDLEKLKIRMKRVYDGWGEKTPCPAVGEDVHFTHTGWNHIITARTDSEVRRRLEILHLAKKLIEKKGIIYTNHWRKYKGRPTKYWRLKDTLDNIKVVVILIRTRIGFLFLSNFEFEDIIQ